MTKRIILRVGAAIVIILAVLAAAFVLKTKRSKTNTSLGSIQGKVISFQKKALVLDSNGKEITVNMSESVKFSYKYDPKTNTPGKQIDISDFSGLKVGDDVSVWIDKTASSQNPTINTIQVLNSP